VDKRTRPELRIVRAAQWLHDAHVRRARFSPLPEDLAPRSSLEAYAIQDEFVALRAQQLGAIAGYKIALSTPAMRQFVGVEAPQAGALLEGVLRTAPSTIRAADYVHLIVEFEIGVKISSDLPAADAPFFRERVVQSVGAVMAALELADDRDADYAELSRHPLHLIADNSWNEGAVLGAERTDWQTIDLAAVRGVATVNGRKIGEGRGADALGHPLDAVAWMADHLASLGRGLLRGDIVITGSLVASHAAKPGDAIEFRLEGLGSAELRVE
jgi:2-keto-4-pentenoate hydratase